MNYAKQILKDFFPVSVSKNVTNFAVDSFIPRSGLFELASQKFLKTTQSQNFIEKSTFKEFLKVSNFFRGDQR